MTRPKTNEEVPKPATKFAKHAFAPKAVEVDGQVLDLQQRVIHGLNAHVLGVRVRKRVEAPRHVLEYALVVFLRRAFTHVPFVSDLPRALVQRRLDSGAVTKTPQCPSRAR